MLSFDVKAVLSIAFMYILFVDNPPAHVTTKCVHWLLVNDPVPPDVIMFVVVDSMLKREDFRRRPDALYSMVHSLALVIMVELFAAFVKNAHP